MIGKEQKAQDREGDKFTTNVKWEGKTPVFETVEKKHDSVLISKEIGTLSEEGKTLTKNIHRSGSMGEVIGWNLQDARTSENRLPARRISSIALL